jgi:hypothetical protein
MTCSNNTKYKSFNDQHKSPFIQFAQTTHKSSRLTYNTKSQSHFTFNKTVKSIQSFYSNNTKYKSFNDQHKSLFIQFAQTTQKSSCLTYNRKSQSHFTFNKTVKYIQSFYSNNTKVSLFNWLAETTHNTSHLMINTKVCSFNLLKQHKSQVV